MQPRTFAVGDVRFVESIAQTLAEAAGTNLSNQRMRQVIESIRDAFVSVDRNLRITYVNARMARFWGFEPSEMIGMALEDVTRPAAESGENALANFRIALQTDQRQSFESLYDDRWYEFRVYPFSDGVAAYVRDITQRQPGAQAHPRPKR